VCQSLLVIDSASFAYPPLFQSISSLFSFFGQIDGLPEGAEPKLTLQLSSPIEEVTLDALYNSAAAANTDESTAGVANFCGVETGQATLTVSAFDADIPLGNSKAYDVAAFTNQLLDDPMLPEKRKRGNNI